MTDAVATGALLAAPDHDIPPSTQLIVDVARKHGVSPLKQFAEMVRLRYGRRKVNLQEYYSNQMYRPELSARSKREFVGRKANFDLNMRLAPRGYTASNRALIADKMLYTAMMAQLGFRTTRTQAVVSRDRGYGDVPTLRNAEDLVAFMANQAVYPIFCKPETGSLSVGSVRIDAFDTASREVVTLTGKRVSVEAFAKQVFAEYAHGFIIQSALQQDPAIVDTIGDAVGSVRVVTILRDNMPEVLYTLWKIPSPKAMSDNYWQDGSMMAEVDRTTGTVLQCRRGNGPRQEHVSTHPVTGAALVGMKIPHWDEVVELTTKAHMVFPRFGVFGWDIGITGDGPAIIECNDNPHHTLYQLATGNGILNADFVPVFDDAAARARTIEARLKASEEKKGLMERLMPRRI
ncbi:MAG: sugar-transfer associated ATP-grasp domain-containing protein [Pseudomonadota bacterium]